MRNRRVHDRVVPKANAPIGVQLIGDGFIELLRAYDISVGGLAVSIPHGVDPTGMRSEVQVIITLPEGRGFSAWGTIRHISAGAQRFGVQFTRIAPENVDRIKAYVERRLAEGGAAP